MRFGEGGPGFESKEDKDRRRGAENARRWERYFSSTDRLDRLDALEEIADAAMENAKSVFALEIAQKFKAKINAKKMTKDLEDHWGDDTYQEYKGVGLFIVHHRTLGRDIVDPDGEIELKEGDQVLDLHLPPPDEKKKKRLRGEAERSFREIAAYIKRHGLKPKYVTGITYEALAELAKRFGFESKEFPLPEDLTEPVENVYSDSDRGRKGIPIGSFSLVWQTLEKFMEKWDERDDFYNTQTLEDALTGNNPERLEAAKSFLRENGLDDARIEASVDAQKMRRETQRRMREPSERREKDGPPPSDEELALGGFIERIEPQVRDALLVMRRKGYNTTSSGFDALDLQTMSFDAETDLGALDDKTRQELEAMGVRLRKTDLSFPWDGKDLVPVRQAWDRIAGLLPDKGAPAPPTGHQQAKLFREKYGKERP